MIENITWFAFWYVVTLPSVPVIHYCITPYIEKYLAKENNT